MTYLLWARTSRRLKTYDSNEIDFVTDGLRDQTGAGVEDPFEGGDHLLWPMRFERGIYPLERLLRPTMGEMFEDWSLTAVGSGIGPEVFVEVTRENPYEVYSSWDERFVHPSSLRGGQVDEYDFYYRGESNLPYVEGISHLDWRLEYDCHGKTGLWVDFARDCEELGHVVRRLERALPHQSKRMWHGRSSLLFAYLASHDVSGPNAYGISETVRTVLDSDEVEDWLAFGIGNESVGGVVENLNPMSDWIWRSRRRPPNQLSKHPARPKEQPADRKVVVVARVRNRPVVRATRGPKLRP